MSDKKSEDKYMNSVFKNHTGSKMDENNKHLLEVAKKSSVTEFIENAFTDKESGKRLTYAEMRERYG